LTLGSASLKKGKKAPGDKASYPDPGFRQRRVLKKSRSVSRKLAASADRRFEFQKRGQLLIRMYTGNFAAVIPCIPDAMRACSPRLPRLRCNTGFNGPWICTRLALVQ